MTKLTISIQENPLEPTVCFDDLEPGQVVSILSGNTYFGPSDRYLVIQTSYGSEVGKILAHLPSCNRFRGQEESHDDLRFKIHDAHMDII